MSKHEDILVFGAKGKHTYNSGVESASEKPLELVRKLVRMYSNEGDVVLDPCIGSGTTIVACRLEGRNYIGFEKNEENYKIASERIASEAEEKK